VTSSSQTSKPHSTSSAHAAATIRAASSGLGGSGFGAGIRGFCTATIGLTGTHPHRTAAAYALLSTAWHCRIDDAASGRQTCAAQRSSHS
jgi:hypothetical protein